MNKSILLLCLEEFPFPARKNGFSIRYFPIIEHFSQKFDIHLFVTSSTFIEPEDLASANVFCTKIVICPRQKMSVPTLYKIGRRLLSLLPFTTPFDKIFYDLFKIESSLLNHFGNVHYDLAVCASLTLSILVRKHRLAKRICVDVIDSPYALKLRSADTLLKRYDAELIRLWERRTVLAADCASYISPLDRNLGCGSTINTEKVKVIPNGVYLDDISSEVIKMGAATIGYLGHMGYPPNIQAALRLYRIFEKLNPRLPDLKLVVIGRDPAPEILALASQSGIRVTGTVENIWPYVNGVDLFVFPMSSGSGQQNKLLEAMAAGKPVISTALGNSGVGAQHGQSVVIAESDDDIAENIVALVNSASERQRIGNNGLAFVNHTYSWSGVFAQLSGSLFAIRV